jgi:hypothetical protein
MTYGPLLFIAALAAILLLCIFFIVCRRYEDGLVGNLALGGMAFACSILLWEAVRGELKMPDPEYCLLIVASAVFLLRHAWRFAMFHWHGHFGWRRPSDNKATGRA